MRHTGNLPIIRADIFKPFLLSARRIGVAVDRHLQLARLPSAIVDEPDRLLPELPCWRFIDSVTRAEGIDTFGLVGGGTIRHFELDSVVPLLRDCSNLNELLQRFIVGAPLVSSVARYSLQPSGADVWFVNEGLRLVAGDVQVQLFQVLGMLQLVQLAAGPDWRPDKACFTFAYDRVVDQAPEFNPSRICFSQLRPAILLPRSLLSRPVRLPRTPGAPVLPLPPTLGGQLAELLMPYIGNDRVSKEMAAEIVGLSPRTLQRRLFDEHTSFAGLVDRMRLQKAEALIARGDMKLIDISLEVGFENAPSFTRAFRRWTGTTPREYRQACSGADSPD